LNNISNNTNQKNYSTLLIIMTPHIVRATQEAGHTPPMLVETAPAQ
jgi:Flp pilus assembly secretin CpaC